MTTQDRAIIWAAAGTIGSFAFFFQWVNAERESKALARSLYVVCETLERASPVLLKRRDMPVTPAGFNEEYERYLRTEARIIERCEAHPERFSDIEDAVRKRAPTK